MTKITKLVKGGCAVSKISARRERAYVMSSFNLHIACSDGYRYCKSAPQTHDIMTTPAPETYPGADNTGTSTYTDADTILHTPIPHLTLWLLTPTPTLTLLLALELTPTGTGHTSSSPRLIIWLWDPDTDNDDDSTFYLRIFHFQYCAPDARSLLSPP